MTIERFAATTLAAIVIVLLLGPLSNGHDPTADAKISLLIASLGSDDYQEREDATRTLQGLGAPALPALREAARSSDREISRRAAVLARRLEVRLESERLLAPEKVRLKAENTPLAELLADLNKRTGLQLVLEGDAEKLGDKKITLDTGEVPVWEAVDQLYRRAGLVDKVQIDTGGHEDRTTITSMRMTGNRIYVREIAEQEEIKLTLTEGEVAKVPSAVSGAIRLRLLASAETTPEPLASGQIGVNLLLTTEPRIQWLKRGAVRIDLARDDQDQSLLQAFDTGSNKKRESRDTLFIGGSPLVLDDDGSPAEHVISVRLRAGKKPTKIVKELRGTITGQIQTAPEPLITIDSIQKAQGKVAASEAGSTLKVTKVAKADDRTYRVEVQLTAPPARLGNVGLGAPGVVIVNHRAVGELEEAVDAPPTNFALLDGNNKPWKIKEMAAKEVGNIGRCTREYDLLFEPVEGAEEPARLVYQGWRLAIVEIPFIMKDVPIP